MAAIGAPQGPYHRMSDDDMDEVDETDSKELGHSGTKKQVVKKKLKDFLCLICVLFYKSFLCN